MQKKDFDFWKDHSRKFLESAYLFDKRLKMEGADVVATKTGDCGDTITFYLRVKDKRIAEINFELDGCIHTNACCNVLVELCEGKIAEDCWEIQPQEIADILETLPPDHFHCAELAVGCFYLALSQLKEM